MQDLNYFVFLCCTRILNGVQKSWKSEKDVGFHSTFSFIYISLMFLSIIDAIYAYNK